MPDLFDSRSSLSLREPRSGRPLRILITRPDEQAEETAALVRAAGGLPLVYPCLRRAPPSDPRAFRASLLHPDGYDLAQLGTFPAGCPVPGFETVAERPPQPPEAEAAPTDGERTA